MLLKPDTRLGHYIIREHKADGGMGAVYRARDTRHGGREVAIKTILADKATDRDLLSRFRLEALAIAQIDHPNIVKLIEFVEGDAARNEPSYMVMELLRGDDLGRIIKKCGELEITRAVDLMLEVCAAVGTCHRRGYLHRDLKPSNIFVAVYDQIETVKVLDFGVAKAWADASGNTRKYGELTRKGTVFGTPEYLAPELLKGEEATPKVDQYAIGVVLYTALTGRKPFLAKPDAEFREVDIMHAVAKGDHPPPRSLRPEIPEGLEAAIERAMHRDPNRRFATVHDLGGGLLPYASTPARHRYTAHFTSSPAPVAIHAQLSIAITAVDDATIPSAQLGHSSTLAVDHIVTRPVGSTELKVVAGGNSKATTVREQVTDQSRRGDSVDPSISIDFEDPEDRQSNSRDAPGQLAEGRTRQARPWLLTGAAGVTILALGLVFTFHRSGAKSPVPILPPASILNPSPVAPSPVSPGPVVPTAQPDLGSRAQTTVPSNPDPAPASDVAPVGRASHLHRPTHRKRKGPDMDEKGVPIPSL